MTQITAKELSAISDLLTMEENLVAKYKCYASEATDASLKNRYEQIAQREAALATHEQAWTVDYIFSYTDLMASLGAGNLREAQQKTDAVGNTLVRRDTVHKRLFLPQKVLFLCLRHTRHQWTI